ncbi:MAG: hypothetical protein LH470_00575 [Lysobacter sp.]|nr:hypothetical protein [Lysobacter sp.]
MVGSLVCCDVLPSRLDESANGHQMNDRVIIALVGGLGYGIALLISTNKKVNELDQKIDLLHDRIYTLMKSQGVSPFD